MFNYSEGLEDSEDLIEPEAAHKQFFPNTTFGYSQLYPTIIDFPYPVAFNYVYVKKHRSSSYFEKISNSNAF